MQPQLDIIYSLFHFSENSTSKSSHDSKKKSKKREQPVSNEKESNGDIHPLQSTTPFETAVSSSPSVTKSASKLGKTQEMNQQTSSSTSQSTPKKESKQISEESQESIAKRSNKQKTRSSREGKEDLGPQNSLPRISSRSSKPESSLKSTESPQKQSSTPKKSFEADPTPAQTEHLPMLISEESLNHTGKVEFTWKTPKSRSEQEQNISPSKRSRHSSRKEKSKRNSHHEKEERTAERLPVEPKKDEQVRRLHVS